MTAGSLHSELPPRPARRRCQEGLRGIHGPTEAFVFDRVPLPRSPSSGQIVGPDRGNSKGKIKEAQENREKELEAEAARLSEKLS